MADFSALLRAATALDASDPLGRFRAQFHRPAGKIDLDGNSLGLLSRRAEERLQNAIAQWRTLGIDGWTQADPPWLSLAETIAGQLAPLVGAARDETCVTGQTTANLHQVLATLFEPAHPTRRVLVGDALNFASDRYALQSHLRLRGLDPAAHLRLVTSRDGRTLHAEDLVASFGPDVQLAVLPAVLFTTGQLLDLGALTRAAHTRGVLIGFDCSHSIGAVPHALAADDVDFAFWCSYKYLNAGPGAVGGLYLHRRHHTRAPGLAGWWGVRADRRFLMADTHDAAPGAEALHIGTPAILSLAPLLGSLELIAEAGGVVALRERSLRQTQYVMDFADAHLAAHGFTIANPRLATERGGHVTLAHPDAWRFCQALKAARIVTDFRRPDLIRLAPSPLYTSYAECAAALSTLAEIAASGSHRKFPADPALVP